MAGIQNNTGIHVKGNLSARDISVTLASRVQLGRIRYNVDAFHPVVYGRTKVVADLHKDIENIKGKSRFVIFGIGGIGKTTVVREYIEEYHKTYYHVIWIHAQNVAAAQNQFRHMAAKKLNIQLETAQNNPDDFSDLLEKIYEKLCSNQRNVLIVLDNAESVENVKDSNKTSSVESLKTLLPLFLPGNYITVLITSRESTWDQDFFHTMKLGPLTDKECISFVLNKLELPPTVKNKKTALGLDAQFNRLTISMQSAVCIIREEKKRQQHEGKVSYGIQDLINDYDRETKGCLPEMQLWNISFEKILKRENGELAIKIICFMAYLSSDAIPKHSVRALFKDTCSGHCLNDAFVLLTKYSLIGLFDTHYTIHRRIQEVVIQNLRLESSSEV